MRNAQRKYIVPNLILVGYGRSQIYMHECVNCYNRFIPSYDTELFCEDCKQYEKHFIVPDEMLSPIKIKGRVVKWEVEFEQSKRRSTYNYKKVMKRDEYQCQYCGYSPIYIYDEVITLSIDHITPFIHRGSNRMSNLVVACMPCNSLASSKIFDTFIDKKIYIVDRRRKKGLKTSYFQYVGKIKKQIQEYVQEVYR